MSFIIDKQTTDDLAIFGKRGRDSIYALFNQTSTRGGAEVLEQMFRYPLTDPLAIGKRIGVLKYFQDKGLQFPFRGELFDTAEHYLSNIDERSKLSEVENNLGRKFHTLIGTDTEYQLIVKGVLSVCNILQTFHSFLEGLEPDESPYREEVAEIRVLFADAKLVAVTQISNNGKLSYDYTASLDRVLRFQKRETIRKLLYYIYNLDAYLTVAGVASKQGFVFPSLLPNENHSINLEGVYHPLVPGAIGNTLSITPENNIVFLTGANMAGKSTFMKSLGTAVYLAHMGFPVAAKKMEFSVRDGLFTTINLPDNLSMGYSHFYAEVLRVKRVAEQLSRSKNLFIIFDELFRGTNVKDAYEATVAITESFAGKRNCMFVVSTHIIEAGDVLKERCDNINFTYLPTRMDGSKPVYTYQLEEGITADRHGMIIVNNEGILDILKRPHSEHQDKDRKAFKADKQTLDDLNILGKYKSSSMFSLFNQVRTKGGAALLESHFQHPLTDVDLINKRSGIFRYFGGKNLSFPFSPDDFNEVESYLISSGSSHWLVSGLHSVRSKVLYYMGQKEDYEQLSAGLVKTIALLKVIPRFLEELDDATIQQHPYRDEIDRLLKIVRDKRLTWLLQQDTGEEFTLLQFVRYDHILRLSLAEEMKGLLQALYDIDLYIAVSNVARQKGFTYARALPASAQLIRMEDLRHPGLQKAVANSISMNESGNVLFLTGANMAGKSTLMKSFAVAVYMAHMGYPVAAGEMEFSVKDGIYTSINVPDNLSLGYSHFYAEVLRVKAVAEAVSRSENLLVIFDELFKGTNVKDAYDATLSVSSAFAAYQNCSFIISTHIIEVGEALKKECNNLQYAYLPTIMEGNVPRYTYKLEKGITTDRHGMMIIENEKILEIIQSEKDAKNSVATGA